jgi:hypothetical protein
MKTTPTGRRSRDMKQIDDYARDKGLTLTPKKAEQEARVKGIHRKMGGYRNFLKLGLEEWPSDT